MRVCILCSMDTLDIQGPLNDPSVSEIEVLIGLEDGTSKEKLEAYMGDDGNVLKTVGFDIYRVRIDCSCLEECVLHKPPWIDFIENTDDTGGPALLDYRRDIGEKE